MSYKRLTVRLSNGKIGCLHEYSRNDLIERLAELEDKIEDKTLIEVPCKVGDKVYMPWEYDGINGIAELTVNDIFIDNGSIQTNLTSDAAEYMRRYRYGLFDFEDIGKAVFLTKAEAEAKLEELRRLK